MYVRVHTIWSSHKKVSANVGCIAARLVHIHCWGTLAGIDFITSGQAAQDGHYFVAPLWGDTVGQEKDGHFSYRHLLDGCNDDQLGLFCRRP